MNIINNKSIPIPEHLKLENLESIRNFKTKKEDFSLARITKKIEELDKEIAKNKLAHELAYKKIENDTLMLQLDTLIVYLKSYLKVKIDIKQQEQIAKMKEVNKEIANFLNNNQNQKIIIVDVAAVQTSKNNNIAIEIDLALFSQLLKTIDDILNIKINYINTELLNYAVTLFELENAAKAKFHIELAELIKKVRQKIEM